jgi:hypothetical protein
MGVLCIKKYGTLVDIEIEGDGSRKITDVEVWVTGPADVCYLGHWWGFCTDTELPMLDIRMVHFQGKILSMRCVGLILHRYWG